MRRRLYLAIAAIAFSTIFSAAALAYIGEGGVTMTIDGVSGGAPTCTTGSNGFCQPMTLAWNKGTTSYYPYAIYRHRAYNCGDGGDQVLWPGVQIACPVPGTSSTTIYPSVPNSSCYGVTRYTLLVNWNVGGCAAMDTGSYNAIGEVDISINPP